MIDQEKLSGQPTSKQTLDGMAEDSQTQIVSVENSEGQLIANGGESKDPNLNIKGFAQPGQKAELYDSTALAAAPGIVDSNGRFAFSVQNQRQGYHYYVVMTADKHRSEPWKIFVDTPVRLEITNIKDSSGDIENGGSTVHSDLFFVGKGEREQAVDLLDHGAVIATMKVDTGNYWSVKRAGILAGSHEFTVRGADGVLSEPWKILVKKPK